MKGIKGRLLKVAIFLIILFPILANAQSYEFGFEVYNAKNCNLSNLAGIENCFINGLENNSSVPKITNGYVDVGDTLMIVGNIGFSNDADATIVNLNFTMDTSKLEPTGAVYNSIWTDDPSDLYSWGILPSIGCTARGCSSKWSGNLNYVGDGEFDYLLTNDTDDDPIQGKTGPLYAFFVTVKSGLTKNSPALISFTYDEDKPSISNPTFDELKDSATQNNLLLSLDPHESNDGTFSSLTATGSNNLNYNFGFVPSSKDDNTYTFMVPNNVTSITFTGTTTDSNVGTITGLNTAQALNNIGKNELTITVLAQNGELQTYHFDVIKLNNNTSLGTFNVTNGLNYGTLDNINANHGGTANVDYIKTSTVVTATAADTNATLTGDGTWNFTTDDLTDTVTSKTITVQAEDCKYTTTQVPGNTCTSQDYTFTTTRTAPSKTAELSTLTIDNTNILVDGQTEYYLEDVLYNKTSINIGATLTDSKSTVEGIGSNKEVKVGDNTYIVKVKAEDCKSGPTNICTSKTYTIHLHQKSHDSSLDSLAVTSNVSGSLVNNNNNTYTFNYHADTQTVTVSASSTDSTNGYVSIIDMTSSEDEDNSIKTKASYSKSFDVSSVSKIGVIITAEDGTKTTYKITLNRNQSTNNNLTALSLSNATINEQFQPDVTSYTATVEPDVEESTVNYTLGKYVALKSITGNTNYSFGSNNVITITTTSETGSDKEYTITVTRKKYSIGTLNDLRVGIGDATPTTISGFSSTIYSYNLSTQANPLSNETTSIYIEYTKGNYYEEVSGDGIQYLQPGENSFDITVLSHDRDPKNTKVYTINVYRAKKTDNETKSITVAGIPANATSDPLIYEVTVPNSISELTPSDVVITVDTTADLSQPTTNFALATKTINQYTYTVTSEAGEPKEYTINITRTSSAVNIIDEVKLFNTASILPNFDPEREDTSYTIVVPYGTTSFDMEVVVNDPEATVIGIGEGRQTISMSNSPLQISVTSGLGETNIYNFTLTETTNPNPEPIPSSNDKLYSLAVDGYTLSPVFDKNTPKYNITVANTVSSVDIIAKTDDDAAKVSINDTDYYSTAEAAKTFTINNLTAGKNIITIYVKAEDNSKRTYEIIITKEALPEEPTPSSNDKLYSLAVDGYTLSPVFDKNTPKYNITVANTVSSVDIIAKTDDDAAKVSINDTDYYSTAEAAKTFTINNLTAGKNIITIYVKAEDNSKRTYEVTINKEALPEDTERITSVTFGHIIEDGYIKTVSDELSVLDLKGQLDNQNGDLEIWTNDPDNPQKLGDTDIVGTGMIVKLVKNNVTIDSKIIIIRGDVSGDGYIDSDDISAIITHYLDLNILTGYKLIAADVNKDDDIDSDDISAIITHYLEIIRIQFK